MSTRKAKNKNDDTKSDSTEISPKKPLTRRSKPKRLTNLKTDFGSSDFPLFTLEDAIKVAQAINDEFAGHSTPANKLARALSTDPDSAYLRYLLRAAIQYGIVTVTGANSIVRLTDLGLDIVSPTTPEQRQKALLNAFTSVELFRKVGDIYGGKPIPEFEFFKNALIRDFGLTRDSVSSFFAVFTGNLEYLKAFAPHSVGQNVMPLFTTQDTAQVEDVAVTGSSDAEGVREFLDTCFILMPFGEWYDKYFRDIYVPATKEAGFEPLRADGLFNVGAVMEQIWTQIKKARVLLADLTGKNPNVFYELGLAHALRKPVVFVAGSIDDVPFDVRHLRVVVYDIREPNWAEKLRSEITMYLKNTKTEPEKSIPQPYRESPWESLSNQSDREPQLPKRRKPQG
jgi:hypothetical protein